MLEYLEPVLIFKKIVTKGKNDPEKADTSLMIPFFSRYFPFLPQTFLTFTECGFTFQVYSLFII
jgi:hypothetical protein